MARPDFKAAQEFQSELRKALDRIPAHQYKNTEVEAGRNAAFAAIKALIEGRGGVVRERFDRTSIRLYGLRAQSAIGLEVACRNWITQLTIKSMAGGAQ